VITTKMLANWRQAKTLAVASLNIDPEITIAMQEMYIEAKYLRKENLRLLNSQSLIDRLTEYARLSFRNHYVDTEMEELMESIELLARDMNINLEIE
jgi:hypothetical protein